MGETYAICGKIKEILMLNQATKVVTAILKFKGF
jgi:hypothetical protein